MFRPSGTHLNGHRLQAVIAAAARRVAHLTGTADVVQESTRRVLPPSTVPKEMNNL